jgi:hypothetical protein
MPVAETYKDVAIFACQSPKRVALVKKEVDEVSRISDLMRLYEIAGDCAWSPEARLCAEARCLAGLAIATERRTARPDIDKENVIACTAGLSVLKWAHPFRHCSLLDADPERAAMREQPLPDME